MNASKSVRKVVSADYDRVPLVTFDLGTYQAVFPLPENVGALKTEVASPSPSFETFQWQDPDNPSREVCFLLISGLTWDCFSAGNISWLGNLMLGVCILENRNGQFNFLNEKSFKEWMLLRDYEFYGVWNEEIREEHRRNDLDIIEEELFSYPLKEDDITSIIANGSVWYREKTGSPKGATHMSNCFRTPINERFSLNIEFRWSATHGTYELLESEMDELQLEYLQKVRLIPNT